MNFQSSSLLSTSSYPTNAHTSSSGSSKRSHVEINNDDTNDGMDTELCTLLPKRLRIQGPTSSTFGSTSFSRYSHCDNYNTATVAHAQVRRDATIQPTVSTVTTEEEEEELLNEIIPPNHLREVSISSSPLPDAFNVESSATSLENTSQSYSPLNQLLGSLHQERRRNRMVSNSTTTQASGGNFQRTTQYHAALPLSSSSSSRGSGVTRKTLYTNSNLF
mmetsp:Transcript_39463/g.57973  ORF Transcript_39463/g.57973 Transcript_39463/m.57973 type:complete len:219 (-) Transcript_39463:332-988(-)|eukprot:CAMPEP_0195533088 /NCGR_PEP_ID=MMETSP0794_2-20130614/39800_1 /TAXON_ID=515487 /ORGANISM="Stephanopyxis turris, Strain CCMP 815" /LENGTH=218 /DNA_ID=CAMNT_0040665515 /DNA_START=150 /DNA_END=806 /DNA_ORIENTATION=+